jgi:hypothetical protein
MLRREIAIDINLAECLQPKKAAVPLTAALSLVAAFSGKERSRVLVIETNPCIGDGKARRPRHAFFQHIGQTLDLDCYRVALSVPCILDRLE